MLNTAQVLGDRRIDVSDFGFFSLAYLSTPNYNAALDFNGDGWIDITDFGQFSVRFFASLPLKKLIPKWTQVLFFRAYSGRTILVATASARWRANVDRE